MFASKHLKNLPPCPWPSRGMLAQEYRSGMDPRGLLVLLLTAAGGKGPCTPGQGPTAAGHSSGSRTRGAEQAGERGASEVPPSTSSGEAL